MTMWALLAEVKTGHSMQACAAGQLAVSLELAPSPVRVCLCGLRFMFSMSVLQCAVCQDVATYAPSVALP